MIIKNATPEEIRQAIKNINNDYIDIEPLILKQDKKYRSRLRQYFTDDQCNSIHDFWIETAVDYLFEELRGEYSAWGSKASKQQDIDMLHAITITHDHYTAGRSGGYVVFNYADSLGELEEVEEDDGNLTLTEMKNVITAYQKDIDAIDGMKRYIKKVNDGMDFKEELKFRIEERMEEIDDELKSERKHRYKVRTATRAVKNSNVNKNDREKIISFIK